MFFFHSHLFDIPKQCFVRNALLQPETLNAMVRYKKAYFTVLKILSIFVLHVRQSQLATRWTHCWLMPNPSAIVVSASRII